MSETKRAPRTLITLDEVGEVSFGSIYMGVRRSKFIQSKDFMHSGELKRITVYVRLEKGASDIGTFHHVQVASCTHGKALLNHITEKAVKINDAEFARAVQTAWKEHIRMINTKDP